VTDLHAPALKGTFFYVDRFFSSLEMATTYAQAQRKWRGLGQAPD
jgi:hypothetical protein